MKTEKQINKYYTVQTIYDMMINGQLVYWRIVRQINLRRQQQCSS